MDHEGIVQNDLYIGGKITCHQGAVLQGTFAHKLSYHLAWDATSTSKEELSLKLGTTEIEVFAWEDGDIPIWCKDEDGKPQSVKSMNPAQN